MELSFRHCCIGTQKEEDDNVVVVGWNLEVPPCACMTVRCLKCCLNVAATSAPICRFCHEGDQTECLMSLCKCSGTTALMHLPCLEHWLNTQNQDHCDFCHHRFPTVGQTACVRLFIHGALHADPPRDVLGDLFCFALMTLVAALSCFFWAFDAVEQARKGRIMEVVSVIILAGLWIIAYLCWFFFLVRFDYRAFALWQAQNTMCNIWVPRGAEAEYGVAGRPNVPDGKQANSRMVDFGAASYRETERTLQLHV
ncbi:hypothetical protein HPB51_026659 [Rhipicephalus microplus]|uniref:RING-CH-type domain-containing protein n=1 Tax=Rhipicephalus microplus TaxID=6941 RepID=A0A9J6D2F5_RHIMP|nr:hypothetical protein HPB51_026659 [Rhipicephalus microplus]